MIDEKEFEKYRKPDGAIDWGVYSMARWQAEIAEQKEKKIVVTNN